MKNEVNTMSEELKFLNQIKPLVILPNSNLSTTKEIANYFEVNDSVIKTIYKNNKQQFNELGSFILTYDKAKNIFMSDGYTFKGKAIFKFENNSEIVIPMRGIRVYPLKCILYIGYMLKNSIVASKLRSITFGMDVPFNIFNRKEDRFISLLIQFINKLDLDYVLQYKVLTYRVDLYIPKLNIAIEYDENKHSGYSYDAHIGRENKIKDKIGCKFIRVDDSHEDFWNCLYIIKEIYNHDFNLEEFYSEYKKLNNKIMELKNQENILRYKYYGQEPSNMFCDLKVEEVQNA